MSILQKYIAKTILTYTALVVFVVLGLDFFIGLLTEMRDIGTGDYGFFQTVEHTVLTIPYSIYRFSPMLLLLGGLIGLGLLASNQELMVMRTSGVSVRKLMIWVAMTGVFLILIATLLGELVAPAANFAASKRKQSAENNGQAVATTSGVWMHEGSSFLHIDRVIGRKHLEGLTRYEYDADHHLLAAYYVKSLDFENHQWQLHKMVKTTFKKDHTVSQNFDNATWDLQLNPNLLNVGLQEPEDMSLRSLDKYAQHLTENNEQATSFQFEFWKRVFQPLATLVMLLLSIPFVFNASRSVSMGWRIMLGVMVGFSFYMLNAFLGQLSVVYQLSPVIAALFPTVLFAVIGFVYLAL